MSFFGFISYEANGTRYLTSDLSFDLVYWAFRGIETIEQVGGPASLASIVGGAADLIELQGRVDQEQGQRRIHSVTLHYDRYQTAILLAARIPKGRVLLAEELRQIIRHPQWLDGIQYLYLQGKANLSPGIDLVSGRCQRCGQGDIVPTACATCGGPCAYCRCCLQMGRSKVCAPLYYIAAEEERVQFSASDRQELVRERQARLQWSGTLTAAQQAASEQAIDLIKGVGQQLLVWAVCGAGKTEVVFGPIEAAARQGQKILLVTPRKDVVLELTPRLKQAFPNLSISSVHGASKEKWVDAELTLSTTHQALRFYKKFDLVILDEVDAFPYHQDPMLYFAVERAKKPTGNLIYLSATPPDYLRSIPQVRIPARYHRKPLAVPHFYFYKMRGERVPPIFKQLLDYLIMEERQAFVFVPYIELVGKLVNQLINLKKELNIAGTHSRDPLRAEKVTAFRKGEIRVLVTTTIMERGVTVPRTDVIVFQADAPIFDEASLVQISGRTGRSFDDPIGRVVFIAREKTREMVKARKHIKKMNKLARKRGLLD
ncbi:hypothetical protein BEP19_13595 [Ammoniphilus oxalaticus]|uniref:DNA/RNA helicase n=1 Tax=Ammoniphilus oxalaticus TaxID=66863 RepID=A0A419SFD4_9BACL|nr:helicase-related protein [Ammoniphilus oxalaticus]RKD22098.1 hypothetical protein BEP19_13595 [Ammoniphilus oxalaticus]